MNSVASLPFSKLNDEEVLGELNKHNIGLTVDEARKISEMIGRDPTLTEAIIWGIQGSEHCSYKSSSRFLKGLPTKGSKIIMGPGEDSGIVAITDGPEGKRWGLVISHESHNHPSQIVPYEGAATGIGGVVRDVVCMGARVIGSMDLLRLGDLKTEESRTIASEVARGIAGYGNPLGIPNFGGDTVFDASYNSNCLVNAIAIGIVREDEIIHSFAQKEAGEVGYDIILVGKPTDRSGFGGASFASAAMDEDEKEKNTGAVQEPNPFLERHLLASTYALFDWLAANKKLNKVSFKDLGAGGVVCASVEQVAELGFGAEVALDKVHVSLDDLPPEVIGCAETQERFCWVCHPDLTEHIINHYNKDWDLPSVAEKAQASVIGKVNTSGVYKLNFKGETVCEAKALDITCGLTYERAIEPKKKDFEEPEIVCEEGNIEVTCRKSHVTGSVTSHKSQDSCHATCDKTCDLGPETCDSTFRTTISEVFKSLISHPNYASTEPITIHYDKNVIGNSSIEAGEADAGLFTPLKDLESYVLQGEHPDWNVDAHEKRTGVAVAGDGCGRYGRISPYLQGLNATIESMRNVAAVGALPRALTDCLNYGNPEIPDQMWELVEGIRGISEAASNVKINSECVPVVSGNVSLYNGQPDGSSIDPTAIVCCVGVISDADKAITMNLKSPDSSIYLIGERKDECGGSAYYQILEEMSDSLRDSMIGTNVPQPEPSDVSKQIEFVVKAISDGKVSACHDVSNGGLLLALFEMTLPNRGQGGGIGVEIELDAIGSDLSADKVLLLETGGFLCEVSPSDEEAFLKAAQRCSIDVVKIGNTSKSPSLKIQKSGANLVDLNLSEITDIWTISLKQALNP